MLCVVAVYLAAFRAWADALAVGGKPVIMVVSPTREQSKIDLSYCRGILESSPILSKLVTGVIGVIDLILATLPHLLH